MGVRAAGDEVEARGPGFGRHHLRVLHHPGDIVLETRLQGLAKGHGLGGNHMHERAALETGKERGTHLLGDIVIIGQHHAATGPAQGLVRRGGHDMGVFQRVGMRATGNESGEMGHVHQEPRTDLLGDVAEGGEIDDSRIG